ncbi:MAG: hypothetical protein JOZ19_13580 [Rubrobacter sp.]|nr:hypothetical protein [Rubrobacter sp.]
MARRRKTIGNSPLDTVVPRREPESSSTQPMSPSTTEEQQASQEGPPQRVIKERLTVHMPVELIDRVKNIVYWTPGLTLARLAEEALTKEVEKREKERGEPFPRRTEELRGGRPLK